MDSNEEGAPAGAGDYEVGYCRPPKHTQFRPGRSGNKNGRPRGAKSLKADLAEELSERIKVTIGGKVKSLTKQRAAVKGLLAKAIKGDMKAINTVLNINVRLQGLDADGDASDLSADDAAILEFALNRLEKRSENSDAEGSGG